jgi:tRNA nucleotidyltransferase (CCA-adding enzyme)
VPVHEVLAAVGVLSRDLGYRAFLVGGIVRDLAIGYPNIDLDIVIEGDAHKVARLFAIKTGSQVKGRSRFGTCKIESRAFATIDMAAARSETYRRPGALPDVMRSDLEGDLIRRDFTINAMAISLEPAHYGKLLDPLGGLRDLAGRRLRVIHEGSFEDDPTRILRGVRFASRYGYRFERKTLRLLRACLTRKCMSRISGKRVCSELELIFKDSEPQAGVGLLKRYAILKAIDPVLGLSSERARHLKKLPSALKGVSETAGEGFARAWLCWFSGLFFGLGRRRSERLAKYFNLPADVRDSCIWVSTQLGLVASRLARLDRSRPYAVTKLLEGVPPGGLVNLFARSGRAERNLIRAYLREWRHVRPSLTGRQIVAMGIKEGPEVGRMLESILKLKLEGKLPRPQDEITYLQLNLPGSELKN